MSETQVSKTPEGIRGVSGQRATPTRDARAELVAEMEGNSETKWGISEITESQTVIYASERQNHTNGRKDICEE